MFARRWTFCVSWLMLAGALRAQATPSDKPKFVGRLIGVYDESSGTPLDSVEVRDMMSGQSALTTKTGTLSLFFVDTAGALMRLRKIGYKPVTIFISNAPDDGPLTLTLEPVAVQLEKVVVKEQETKYTTPALHGFEERMKSGLGYFIPDSILRRDEGRTLANVIRLRIPAVSVVERTVGTKRAQVVLSRRDNDCMSDIYLDGIRLTSNQGSVFTGRKAASPSEADLNLYDVSTLAAVEFHGAADMPPEYNATGSGCGALFLWTRIR